MDAFIHTVFQSARTHTEWLDKPVDESLLQAIYHDMKWGPTSANCCPLRIVFVQSKEAKEKLKPCLAPGNVDKTMSAPVTAIFAQDMAFYDHFGYLFPYADAKSWFTGTPGLAEETALRNSTLQAAYFIVAARARGLDCGPMSGFDKQAVDNTFLNGTTYQSNFICNLGYGDGAKLHPRLPRFDYADVCKVV